MRYEDDLEDVDVYDFFAAHAPNKIPYWFESAVVFPYPSAPEPDPSISDEAIAWRKDDCYDLDSMFEPNTPEREAAEAYRKAHYKWIVDSSRAEDKNKAHRYFAWRWYYAKMMIEHRKEEV